VATAEGPWAFLQPSPGAPVREFGGWQKLVRSLMVQLNDGQPVNVAFTIRGRL
jgi:VCBS repeat-containing protein